MSDILAKAARGIERATLGRLVRRRNSREDRAHDIREIACSHAAEQRRRPVEQIDFKELGESYGQDPAALHALADAQAGLVTRGFDDEGKLLILAEPHIFSKLTHHAYDLTDPNCSYPEWIAYRPGASPPPAFIRHPYAMTNAERWELWGQMAQLDFEAACGALRVGRFQYLAANWRELCGWSAAWVVRNAQMGERDQVELLCRFVEVNLLGGALRARDWPTIARAYNPPGQWESVADKLAERFKSRTRLYA